MQVHTSEFLGPRLFLARSVNNTQGSFTEYIGQDLWRLKPLGLYDSGGGGFFDRDMPRSHGTHCSFPDH